jgi:hypothetical protein
MHNLSVRYLASSARTQIDRFCPSSLCFHTCYSSSPNFPYNRMHPILCVLLYQKARRKFSLLHQVPIRVNGLLAVSWSRFDCVRSTCSFNTSLFFGQREPLSDKGTSNLLPMTSVCATPPWLQYARITKKKATRMQEQQTAHNTRSSLPNHTSIIVNNDCN